MFKNWRALLFLSFFLVFFILFFYFFVLEKNIIQFVSTAKNKQAKKIAFKHQKTYQVKQRPAFAEQSNNWKQLKPFLQKFLRNLFPVHNPLLPFLKLQYRFKARNHYLLRPIIAQQAFENHVLHAIREQIGFYDYQVVFSYDPRYLTVKITLSVLQKPRQTIFQLYQLSSSNSSIV